MSREKKSDKTVDENKKEDLRASNDDKKTTSEKTPNTTKKKIGDVIPLPRPNARPLSDSKFELEPEKKSGLLDTNNVCPTCESTSHEHETMLGFKIKNRPISESSWLQTIRVQRAVLSDCERLLQRCEDIRPGSSTGLFEIALCLSAPDDDEYDEDSDEQMREAFEDAVTLVACSDFLGERPTGELGVDLCGCIAVCDEDGEWHPLDDDALIEDDVESNIDSNNDLN